MDNITDFNTSFIENISEDKIKQNFILTAIDQMNSMIDQKMSVPQILQQNKYIFAKVMFKNKALQNVICQFSQQLQKILTDEFTRNEQNIQKFMKITRSPDQSIGNAQNFLSQILQDINNHDESNKNDKIVKQQKGKDAQILLKKKALKQFQDKNQDLGKNLEGILKSPKNQKRSFQNSPKKFDHTNQNSFKDQSNKSSQKGDDNMPSHFGSQDDIMKTLFTEEDQNEFISQDLFEKGNNIVEDSSENLIYSYISKIKNKNLLFLSAKVFLIPKSLPQQFVPEDQFIKAVAEEQSKNLISFYHKKKAVETMHKQMNQEISRKKHQFQVNQIMEQVGNKLDTLNNDCCALFNNMDHNEERLSKPQILRNFQLVYDKEPYKAQQVINAKGVDFLREWGQIPVTDHQSTLNKWSQIWQENKELEELIMNESQGYKLELQYFIKKSAIKLQQELQKSDFYIQSLELALNQANLDKQQIYNRLQMVIADTESKEDREMQKKGGLDEKMQQFLQNFMAKKTKFTNLKEANDYVIKMKEGVQYIIDQNQFLQDSIYNLNQEKEWREPYIKKINEENLSKSLYYEWIHQIIVQNSSSNQPKPILNVDNKKKLEISKKENIYSVHSNLLKNNDIQQKITNEVQTAKVFSILVFNLYQIFQESNILDATSQSLKQKDALKKFKLKSEHILDIANLFKGNTVADQMIKLMAIKQELIKFGKNTDLTDKQHIQQDDFNINLDEGHNQNLKDNSQLQIGKEEANKIISKKYMKLRERDFQFKCKFLIEKTIDRADITANNDINTLQQDGVDYQNSETFVNNLNKILINISQPLNQNKNCVRLSDIIKIEQDRLILNNQKFSLFVHENKHDIERGDSQKGNFIVNQFGYLINTIKNVNMVLSGRADILLDENEGHNSFYLKMTSTQENKNHEKDNTFDDQDNKDAKKGRKQTSDEKNKIERLENDSKMAQIMIKKLKEQLQIVYTQQNKDQNPENFNLDQILQSQNQNLDDQKNQIINCNNFFNDVKIIGKTFETNEFNIYEMENLDFLNTLIQQPLGFLKNIFSQKYQNQKKKNKQNKQIINQYFKHGSLGRIICYYLFNRLQKKIKKLKQLKGNSNINYSLKIINEQSTSSDDSSSQDETIESDQQSSQKQDDYNKKKMNKKDSFLKQFTNKKQFHTKPSMKISFKSTKIQKQASRYSKISNDNESIESNSLSDISEQKEQQLSNVQSFKIQKQFTSTFQRRQLSSNKINKFLVNKQQTFKKLKSNQSIILSDNKNRKNQNLLIDENKNLLENFQIDSILLKDKYQIFPAQRKLNYRLYLSLKDKLEKINIDQEQSTNIVQNSTAFSLKEKWNQQQQLISYDTIDYRNQSQFLNSFIEKNNNKKNYYMNKKMLIQQECINKAQTLTNSILSSTETWRLNSPKKEESKEKNKINYNHNLDIQPILNNIVVKINENQENKHQKQARKIVSFKQQQNESISQHTNFNPTQNHQQIAKNNNEFSIRSPQSQKERNISKLLTLKITSLSKKPVKNSIISDKIINQSTQNNKNKNILYVQNSYDQSLNNSQLNRRNQNNLSPKIHNRNIQNLQVIQCKKLQLNDQMNNKNENRIFNFQNQIQSALFK